MREEIRIRLRTRMFENITVSIAIDGSIIDDVRMIEMIMRTSEILYLTHQCSIGCLCIISASLLECLFKHDEHTLFEPLQCDCERGEVVLRLTQRELCD